MKRFYIALIAVAILGVLYYAIHRSPVIIRQNDASGPFTADTPRNNYGNTKLGFSVNVPAGYTTDQAYEYQKAPKQVIPGVKFTIPASVTTGTNLSKDSYVSVEKLAGVTTPCSADSFLDGSHDAAVQTFSGLNFSVATAQNAGAGNRYDETVYALQGNTCVAVRYYVHYGAIQNYPKGSVKEFDRDALLKSFDSIRDSIVII